MTQQQELLWKTIAKHKHQQHRNALAALTHNLKRNQEQQAEIEQLQQQLEDAQHEIAELRRGQYVPVEDGEYSAGKLLVHVLAGRYVIATKATHDDTGQDYWNATSLPNDYRLCRLAAQEQEGGRVRGYYDCGYDKLMQGVDPNDYDDYPICPTCGSGDGDWVDCPHCAGEGGFDDEQLMNDDPMWYQPGDYEKCDLCDGEGGWWQCWNTANHPTAQQEEGDE